MFKRSIQFLVLLMVMIAPWGVKGQTLSDYQFSTGTDNSKWIELTSPTTLIYSYAGDAASKVTDIGFSFPFDESVYTQFSVNTDGNLRLGSTKTTISYHDNPFGYTNSNNDTPKINAFGCDGTAQSGHYVKYKLIGNNLLVVEYCLGTYKLSTRDYLYKWQIHLYANGNIEIVFPDASGIPETAPSVTHQCGLCVDNSDGWIIKSSNNTATHFTAGSSITNASGTWFDANRYYRFERPTCPTPMNLHANLTEGNGAIATLVWTEKGTASNWEVIYGTDPTLETHLPPITTGFNATGSTISCNLTGLTAETPYYAKVKAVCEAGVDESDYTDIIEFIPSDTHTFTINDPTTTTSSYIPFYYSVGSYSTIKSQFITLYTDLTGMRWGEIKKLTFYNSSENVDFGTAKFNVYMATTPSTTLSSFVDWSSMTKVVNNGSVTVSGNKMEIVFDTPFTYTVGNLIIGFSQSSTGTSGSFADTWVGKTGTSGQSRYYSSYESSSSFLPKVTFNYLEGEAPDCIPVSNLSYSNEQATSVDLNWDAGESGETAWKLQYKKTTEAVWTTYPSAITEKPFTLPNLSEMTTYQWRVAAWCDTSDPAGISDYVAGEDFSTKQALVVVGDSWSDNFEGASCGWQLINGNVTNANWAWGTAEHNGEGTHSIYITKDGGATCSYNSSGYAIVYATKHLIFADGKYTFQFDWKCKGETTSHDYLSVGLLPATTVLTANNNISNTFPTGWVALHDASYLNGVTTWQTSPEKTIQVAAGNYYLVLRWRQDSSNTEGAPAAVDNISITRLVCNYDVAGLEVATEPAPTAHTATINWTDGDPGQWQVAWSKDNTFAPANTNTDIVSTNTIDLDNLDAASTYYVKVRAYCGGEDYGTWCEAVEFLTECEAISDFPWSYNFDSDAAGDFNKLCWVNERLTGFKKFMVASTYNGTNYTNQLYFPFNIDSEAKLVLPALDIPTGKTYQFVIDVYRTSSKPSYDDGIRVYSNTSRDLEGATELGFLYRVCTKTDGGVVTAEQITGWYTYAFEIPYDGNCFVILKGEGTGGDNTYVDNFVIRQIPDCATPTGLAVTANSQTPEGATITWKAGDASSWIVEYKTATTEWTATADSPVSTTTYTFTGLNSSTSYQTRVSVVCSAGDGVTYPTAPVQFTTDISCPAPKHLVVSNITSTSATLTWTPGYTETEWTVKYKKHADAEYTTVTPNVTVTPTVNLPGLAGATSYDVQIIGCDPNHIYSVSNAFTTEYGVPFIEAFTSYSQPADWNQYSGLMTNVLAGTESLVSASETWFFNDTNVFGAYHARLHIFGKARKHWLVTPNIEIGNDNYNLNFDIALTEFISTNAAGTDCDDDKFAVLISTDNGATWSQLALWDNAGSERVYNDIKTTGEEVNLDLSSYKNQKVRIAFYGESTVAADNGNNDLHIDNVNIDLTPACHRPSGLTASDVTNHSATLTWVPGSNDQTAWEFKYNKGADFDPTAEGTLVEDIDENHYTYDKTLDAASTYYFYVRGNCGGTPSAWSKDVCSFTTEVFAPAPTTFATTEVGPDWVELYWNAPAGDYLSGYGIYYSTTSTPPTEETDATVTIGDPTAPTAENPYRLPGLEYEETYYLWIRANHETDVYSAWTAITGASITTLPSCPIPTDLNASNLTQSTADLSWAGSSAMLEGEGYTVQYKKPAQYDYDATEDFSGLTAVAHSSPDYYLPDGWKSYNSDPGFAPRVSSSIYYDFISVLTDNFLLLTFNKIGQYAIAIMPKYSEIGSVEFNYAYENKYHGELTVGYVTNNLDYNTYVPLQTPDQKDTKTKFTLSAESIATINTNNGYIAFRYEGDGNIYYSVGIDDIVIPGGEYHEATTWQTAATGYKAGYTYQLTGLTADTKYDARVYSNCTTDADNENASTSFTTKAVSTKVFVTAGDWSTASNWIPAEIPTITDNVIIRANVTIPKNYVAYANNVTLENSAIITIKDGGELYHSNAVKATMEKEITGASTWGTGNAASDGWYLISNPLNSIYLTPNNTSLVTNLAPDDVAGVRQYDLYKYIEADINWYNYHSHTSDYYLTPGVGFLYSRKEDATISFKSTLNLIVADVSPTLTYTGANGEDKAGWNLLGNPFSHSITWANLVTENVTSTGYYLLGFDGQWTAEPSTTATIKPMEGFLVKANAASPTVTIKNVAPTSKDRANHDFLAFTIANSNYSDITYAMFSDDESLEKIDHRNANIPMIYIPQDGENYAIATMNDNTEMFGLNVKAMTTGKYTLKTKANGDFSYLHIIDRLTGDDVDMLLEGEYSFIASPQDTDARFIVKLRYNANGTVTSGDIFAYQNGSDIVVNGEGELQVFDVMGRLIATQHINGVQTVNVNTTGVYIFKFNEKVQKIVVR